MTPENMSLSLQVRNLESALGDAQKLKGGIWGTFKAPSGSQTCPIRAPRKLRGLDNIETV